MTPIERVPQPRHPRLSSGALLGCTPLACLLLRPVSGPDAFQLGGIGVGRDAGDPSRDGEHVLKVRPRVDALVRRHEIEHVTLADGLSARSRVMDPSSSVAVNLARDATLASLAPGTLAELQGARATRRCPVVIDHHCTGQRGAHRVHFDPPAHRCPRGSPIGEVDGSAPSRDIAVG
jgi:hypothetical protein